MKNNSLIADLLREARACVDTELSACRCAKWYSVVIGLRRETVTMHFSDEMIGAAMYAMGAAVEGGRAYWAEPAIEIKAL